MAEFVQEGEVLEIIDSKTRNGTFWRVKVLDLETKDEDQFGMGKEKPSFGEGSIISFEFEESEDGKYLNMLVDTLEVIDEVKPKGRGNSGSSRSSGRSGGRDGGKGSNRSSGRGRGNDDDDGGSSRSRSSSRSGSSRGGSSDSGSRSGSRSDRGSKGSGESKGSKSQVDWEAKDKRIELMSARNSALELVKIAVELEAFPLGTKSTKAADKFELLQDLVNQETARFLEQNEAYMSDGIDAIFSDAGDE